jgi:molecular chaperone DnaK
MASQNRTLGRFDLVGIPPAPRGVPQIEVSFDIDANGIVHVSAKDLGTGKEQKIRIESSSGLSEDEINRMVKEAESHAEEDKKAREAAEARNEADTLIYSTEKSLNDYGDKISDTDKQQINDAIGELRSALETNDPEQIKSKMDALKQASYKLAEEVYKNASADQQGDGSGEGPEGDTGAGGGGEAGAEGASGDQDQGAGGENVEDVDYEVVDEEDKNKNE